MAAREVGSIHMNHCNDLLEGDEDSDCDCGAAVDARVNGGKIDEDNVSSCNLYM